MINGWPAGSLVTRTSRGVEAVLLVVLTVSVLMLATHSSQMWIVAHHSLHLNVALSLVGFCLFVVATRRVNRAKFYNLLLAALLGSIYFSYEITGLGDAERLAFYETNHLRLSELLSNLPYLMVNHLHLPYRLVPPLCGLFTALGYFSLCDYLFRGADNERQETNKCLYCLFYLASGVHLVFFAGYLESTLTSLPWLVWYIYFCLRYYHTDSQRPKEAIRNLSGAALCLALAALFHGQITFLTPALLIVILLKRIGKWEIRALWSDLALASVIAIGLVVATYFLLVAVGFDIEAGNIQGGGDSLRFVPLDPSEVRNRSVRFGMFSVAHFTEVANILAVASPLCVWLWISRMTWKEDAMKASRRSDAWCLQLMALGYVSLAFLWNFDLHFPIDYDLMLSMSIPFHLSVLSFVMSRPHGPTYGALLWVGGGITYSWCIMSSFLRY